MTKPDFAHLPPEALYEEALQLALGWLGRRMYSVHELEALLARRAIPSEVGQAVIARLEALNYLNDKDYAQRWLAQRCASSPRGRRALQYELRQKGIENSLIEECLAPLDFQALATRAAQSKLKSLAHKPFLERRRALATFLQGRGFEPDLSYDVTRQLIQAEGASDDEPDGDF